MVFPVEVAPEGAEFSIPAVGVKFNCVIEMQGSQAATDFSDLTLGQLGPSSYPHVNNAC